jgi:hypothetical protein
MGIFNLFKAQFKKPAFETADSICNSYIDSYARNRNSREAFESMANEAFKQLKDHGNKNFFSVTDTHRMLGIEPDKLLKKHSKNEDHLFSYVINMMVYIRPDLYDYQAGADLAVFLQRLKTRVRDNLTILD